MIRDMLLKERRFLGEIVNLIGCNNRQYAEHFIGSLLLNPMCFGPELASPAFDRCVNDSYDGGRVFHTFALLLRIYHRRDCSFCKGGLFSEPEMRRAQNHHMKGRDILESLEIEQWEVKDAARKSRQPVSVPV